MLKNSIFSIIFLALITTTGCVSVLSQMSDEEAWSEYFKDIKTQQQQDSRSLASERTGVKILRQILEGMPFRSFLISCEQRECFQSKLVLAFDQAFQRLKEQKITLTLEEYSSEQKVFLEQYSYEKVLSWVEAFHHMLLSGVELRAAQRSVDLAHSCEFTLASDSDIQLSNFYPYLGGITYLPRSFYACLNGHWLNELDQLLKETTDRLGVNIKTDEAKKWIIQSQISPIYKKTLNNVFVKRQEQEMLIWNQAWQETEKKINWKLPLEELIRVEVPLLRTQYHFINIESLLSGKKLSKK